ncbi:hypothetical protein X740_25865 [Mesorhizobium sp. LNHC221B00]|nr:hypothetical protein X740_25865 [Mesorhizobium sp. LNHC221B00]
MGKKALDRVRPGNPEGFGIGRIKWLAMQVIAIGQEH